MSVKVYVKGKLMGEFEDRPKAVVACFENGLTYDQHSRKRNQILPTVKLVEVKGEDDWHQ